MKTLASRWWAVLLTVGLFFILLPISPHPAHSQDAVQVVESDDPRVLQVGTWSTQTAPAASNSNYLFSTSSSVGAGLRPAQSTNHSPTLALAFIGSAIEIDGTVVRTVITTTEKIDYGLSAKVDYLSDEPHSLKVYAQEGGIIAVDAFRISPVIPIVGDGPVPSQDALLTDDDGIQSSTCAPLTAIHRVSLTNVGGQGTADSIDPSLSADGRYVAFGSSTSLVPGDGDSVPDVYLYDRQTCAIQLVSVSSGGVKGNGDSINARISGNGRYLSFASSASNLVTADTNTNYDVFVRDLQAQTTTRVSVVTGGAQATGGNSFDSSISADGRYVSFSSFSPNVVAGDSNAFGDIFVHDRQTNTTTRVSVATGGTQSTGGSAFTSRLSADGRYVVFESDATNLVASDTNGVSDIFVHDRQTTTTTRVSVATGGTQATGGPSYYGNLSTDGRYVTFNSGATNLVAGDTNVAGDIFVHDRQTTTTTRVSVATGGTQATGGESIGPAISGDGRYIAFASSATNLVAVDTNALTDVFVHDRTTSTTIRVSVSTGGGQGTGGLSTRAAISNDGRYITFDSAATNLIINDSNGVRDIFVTLRSLVAADTLALFRSPYNQVNLLNTLADNPAYSAYTAFSAYAPVTNGQWVMGDWNGDGLDTPGVYANGPFYYTNKSGESQPSDWRSLWIGVAGAPVSGRFSNIDFNDCIGVVQSASFPPFGTAFVLYLTCDLSGNPAPTIGFQWLSIVLPDSGGFSGTHQFGAGDFNSDGLDSIAIRRGNTIAFGNVAPVTGAAAFDLAQFIGAPGTGDEGIFVVGDWDASGADSFGLFYQNGELFYRNDLLFNSGAYTNQSVGTPFGNSGVQATTWR